MMIKLAQQLCEECTPLLISSSLQPARDLEVAVLEGVAKARYTLALTAEFMYKSAVEDTAPWNDLQIKSELQNLFEAVRRMCYKSLSAVPRLYLLKQLARRFGVEVVHMLCGRKEFEWIVPPESRVQQVNKYLPQLVVMLSLNPVFSLLCASCCLLVVYCNSVNKSCELILRGREGWQGKSRLNKCVPHWGYNTVHMSRV